MGSDNQWTALGPAIIGFQTNSSNIDKGAVIAGNVGGVEANCAGDGDGVFGNASRVGNGVRGQASNKSGCGVYGENTGAGFGVGGVCNTTGAIQFIHFDPTVGPGAGIMGVNRGNAPGVIGSSAGGVGVWGSTLTAIESFTDQGDGVVGDGKNGVHGRSRSPTDSGVWGENLSFGVGVAGSSVLGIGVSGTSIQGKTDGVFGLGKNGVHGKSSSQADSGVWGEHPGSGAGVGGSSVNGYGGDFMGGLAPVRIRPSNSTGAPPPIKSINHQIGELFVDKQGDLYIFTETGWKKVQLI